MSDSTNLTFSELRYLKAEQISLCITKEAALDITQHAQQDATVGAEILGLWADKLLQTYSLTAAEWLRLSQYLLDNLQQKILVAIPGDKHILELTTWLGDCMKLTAWLEPLMARFDLECTCIALAFVLQTVIAFLSFYKKWYKKNDLAKPLQSALMLQNSIVKALNQNTFQLEVKNECEFFSLTEVIVFLSEVGEQTHPVDIKTIVETWKCVAMLINYLSKYLHLEHKLRTTERIWVKRPLLFLLQEIGRNLSTIYKEETLKQPVEQVEKYLRVTNFYLKLLLGLTSEFKHNEFPVVDELLNIIGLSKRVPTYFRDTDTIQLLEKYVQNGLKDVLKMTYKHTDVRSALLKQHTDPAVILYYLDVCVDEQDIEFISENVAGFVELFEFYFNDMTAVTNAALFNDVLMNFAALTVLDVSAKFTAYLRENVLKADAYTAHISTQLLLIVSHRLTGFELLHEFQFWLQCNDLFALCSTHPKQFHIQQLLRHFFRLCKSCKALLPKQLWDECSATELIPKNYRFLLAVGLDAAANSALEPRLIKALKELLDKRLKDVSKANYYEMTIFINLLATANKKPNDKLLAVLFQHVAHICSIKDENVKEFHQFLNASYALATTFVETISPSLLQILLKSFSRGGAALITIPCVNLLKACSQHSNKEIRTVAVGLLRDCGAAHTNQIAFALFHTKSSAGKPDADLFRRLSKRPAKQHICSATTSTSPASKRIRLEEPDNSKLKCILDDMLGKSQTILDLSGNMEHEDLKKLNSIVNILNLALVPK